MSWSKRDPGQLARGSKTRLINTQVDMMVDAYVYWREASIMVSDAYHAWAGSTGPNAADAFGSYMSALDHEEQAAKVYARLVRRVAGR